MGSCLTIESRNPHPGSPTSPGLGIRKRKNSKRRLGSRNSSFDFRWEDSLHRIPGRLFLNGSSNVASLFTQQGRKGTNQDAMLVWENFASRTNTVFCGIFDGHGPFGHMVAKRVRDSLPLKLSEHWEMSIDSEDVLKEISPCKAVSMNSEDTAFISADEESRASVDLEEVEKNPEIFRILKESFMKAYKVMDRELRLHTNIDCFCSGTTAVTLVKQGHDLIVGYVGDSRAVLGTRDKDDSLVAVQLTVDLKPNLPAESERIRKCRGRVFALRDEPEVFRVWLPNNDSPGLAMARAFGDFCLKDYGLISVPEVSYRRLTDRDQFIILATDGIWDVLTNKEVVDIIASAPSRSSAARCLVESAVRSWRYKYPTSKVDDCAVVCLFLDSCSNDVYTAFETQPEVKEDHHPLLDHVGTGKEKKEDLNLGHSATLKSGRQVPNGQEVVPEESAEDTSESDHKDTDLESDTDWSALEGVSRVNTLVNLPRFVPGNDAARK